MISKKKATLGKMATLPPLQWQVGFDTDIGGGRENQDDFFFWHDAVSGVCVACVLDGHGREVGKVAAVAAKNRIHQYCQENTAELLSDTPAWLVKAHDLAHLHIKSAFKHELELQGNEVIESEEGYLLKRKSGAHSWSCVHGGSSCSIVVIIGYKMFIANVGDSAGILCTPQPILSSSALVHISDAATSSQILQPLVGPSPSSHVQGPPSDTLLIIAEHSPESPAEFMRLRNFRQREGDPAQPALLVVYDAPSTAEKSRCNPVFDFDINGNLVVTNRGRFVSVGDS